MTLLRAVLMLAAAICAGVVVYYAVIFPGSLPDHRWIVGYNDLILHFAAFLVLSLPLLVLWPARIVIPVLALLAATLELAQFWLPRRNPGWDDLCAGIAGAVTGAGLVAIGRRVLPARRRG